VETTNYEAGGMEITCIEVMENTIGVEADVDGFSALLNAAMSILDEAPIDVLGRAQCDNPRGGTVRTWKRKAREIKKKMKQLLIRNPRRAKGKHVLNLGLKMW
jgi:hypothetical protein